MRCNICGEETFNEKDSCSACRAKLNQIQVLSPDERENFKGVTIEQGAPQNEDNKYANYRSFQRVYTFNSSSAGILTKLILGAIMLFLIIVLLPVALTIMALFALSWFIRRSKP